MNGYTRCCLEIFKSSMVMAVNAIDKGARTCTRMKIVTCIHYKTINFITEVH